MSKHEDTIPKRIRQVAQNHPDVIALLSKDNEGVFQPITYNEFYKRIKIVGTALHDLGVKRDDHVGIISHNRAEWMITDQAILGLGAADVPRGSDSTQEEVGYILNHSDCSIVFAENKEQVQKILTYKKDEGKISTIIVFDDNLSKTEKTTYKAQAEIISFQELYETGENAYKKAPDFFDKEVDNGASSDLATIIYTSGTTGEPKGVMLTHRNYTFQIERVYEHVHIETGHVFITVLPIWHSFERAVEYIVLNIGASIGYSKPIGKIMLDDMLKLRPHWMASVPRIWEGVRSAVYRNVNNEGGIKKTLFYFFVGVGQAYAALNTLARGLFPQFSRRNRIIDFSIAVIPLVILTPLKLLGNVLVFKKLKTKLGGRFIAGISGGGALPPYVDKFFMAANILLLEGYGLTETGPILAVRKQHAPVPNTVGPLLRDIDHRVLDSEMNPVPPGKKGVLYVKSEQIMKGYYKKPEATAEILHDGWLNTGDIAVFTHTGDFKIIGREKDTIVLMGGENIEPVPIEDKLSQSSFIDQVMIVGQDQKYLGALIIANMEQLEASADEKGIQYIDSAELLTNPEIQNIINNEIQSRVNPKNGFKSFERIFRFTLLEKPFEIGKELTQTLKIKRNVVEELYKKQINQLFDQPG